MAYMHIYNLLRTRTEPRKELEKENIIIAY